MDNEHTLDHQSPQVVTGFADLQDVGQTLPAKHSSRFDSWNPRDTWSMEHKKTTHMQGSESSGSTLHRVQFLKKVCKHLSTQKLQCSWEAVQVLSLNSALDVHLHRICIHRFRLRHLTGEWNHLRNGRLPLINSNLQSSVEFILQNGLINSIELSESYIIRIDQYHSSSYQSEHIFSCTTFPCRLKTFWSVYRYDPISISIRFLKPRHDPVQWRLARRLPGRRQRRLGRRRADREWRSRLWRASSPPRSLAILVSCAELLQCGLKYLSLVDFVRISLAFFASLFWFFKELVWGLIVFPTALFKTLLVKKTHCFLKNAWLEPWENLRKTSCNTQVLRVLESARLADWLTWPESRKPATRDSQGRVRRENSDTPTRFHYCCILASWRNSCLCIFPAAQFWESYFICNTLKFWTGRGRQVDASDSCNHLGFPRWQDW